MNKKFFSNLDLIGYILFSISTGFCLLLMFPAVQGRYLFAGDTFWHYSNELHLIRSLSDGQGLFSCFTKGMGLPLLNMYQPLLYIIVGAIHFLCMRCLSVYSIHNTIVVVLFCFYPASLFFMARSFRFNRFTAGLISLFAPVAVSGWGHTLDAYFWIGLHTQALGAVLFPVVLGLLNQLGKRRVRLVLLVVFAGVLGALMMAHAILAVLCFYSIGIYSLMMLLCRWNVFRTFAVRLVMAGMLTAVMIAFWLVPFLYFNHEYKFIPETERSFSPLAVSVTLKDCVNTLCTGQLLDNASETGPLFGGGEEGLRWSMNSRYNRFGIFTILALGGVILVVISSRKRSHWFFIFLFMSGLILFAGKDDIPLLRILPFSSQFQAIRAVFLIEISASVLAGLCISRIIRLLMYHLKRKQMIRYAPLLLIVLCLPLYRERALLSKSVVRSGESEAMRQLNEMYSEVDNQSPLSRVFFGTETAIPSLSLRALADCHFLNNAVGHDNEMTSCLAWNINFFKMDIPSNPQLLDLLNISCLISAADWQRYPISAGIYPVSLHKKRSTELFAYYEPQNVGEHFFVYPKKPVLVLCNKKAWYLLNRKWLSLFVEYGYDIAPLVKATDGWQEWDLDTMFSTVILIDFPVTKSHTTKDYQTLNRFVAQGGTILSNKPVWDIPVEKLIPSRSSRFLQVLRASPIIADRVKIVSAREQWFSQVVNVESDIPVFLCAKTAFFHTWHARTARREIQTVQMSPLFLGMQVMPSDSLVKISYEPSAWHTIFLLCGLVILLMVFFARNNIQLLLDSSWTIKNTTYAVSPLVVRMAFGVVLAYVGVVYVQQQVGHKTSLIYPYNSMRHINPHEIVFRWNEIDHAGGYEFQLSSDKHFTDIVLHVPFHDETTLGYRGLYPYRNYYWRVRPVIKNNTAAWSATYSFRTGNYFPVAVQ